MKHLSQHRPRRLFGVIAITLATVGAGVGIASPAQAEPRTPTAAQAAATVASSTAVAHQVAGLATTGDPGNTPAVSTSSTGDVSAVSPQGTNIGIKLPATPKTKSTVMGAAVLSSADPSVAVVGSTTGGVQVSQDILSPSAPTSYSYRLSLPVGYRLVPQPNGTVAIMTGSGDAAPGPANTIGWIDQAWAVDANGVPVSTTYSVRDKTLTQTVSYTSTTAFPVVADPTVSFGWLVYVHWYHSEVAEISWLGYFTGAATIMGWACTKIPIPWVDLACAVYVAVFFAYAFNWMQTAYQRGGGLVIEFVYGGSYWGHMYVGDNWS